MTPPSGQQIHLVSGEQELVVVEVGGGIRTYTAGGRHVLDGYAETEMCSGGRGQLLAPWPNRLQDGRFEWDGRQHQTPLSEPENGNAIHGLVRWSTWTAADRADDRVTMEFRLHPQPGWPWTLDFSVAYQLDDAGLGVHTSVVNSTEVNGGSCPIGLGWHPYVAAAGGLVDDLVLTVPAAERYQSDARGIPVGRGPVGGTELDFRRGRRIGDARLDAAFTSLDRDRAGRAVIEVEPDGRTAAASGVRLWMDQAYTHLMIFSGDTLAEPVRRRGLAIEPMTCAPDMLRSGDGRRILHPGERLDASWGIEPFSFR